jgi:hypothetical protein
MQELSTSEMTSLRGGKNDKADKDKLIIKINHSFSNDTVGSGIANGSGGIGNESGGILTSFDNQVGVFIAL